MFALAALLVFGAAPPAQASCRARLSVSLSTGTPQAAARCFAPGASWVDGTGRSSDAVAGLARLRERSQVQDPRWVQLSSGSVMLTGLGDVAMPWPGQLLLVLDGGFDGPWTSGRVYRGSRPWPQAGEPRPEIGGPDTAAFETAFNETMGAGDPAAWAARWAPDAEFVSVVGPYRSAEVAGFFANQSRRYAEVGIRAARQHDRRRDGSTVFEGALRGRCRSNGEGFSLPFLMAVQTSSGAVSSVYEAFSSLGDGCGPFWALPR